MQQSIDAVDGDDGNQWKHADEESRVTAGGEQTESKDDRLCHKESDCGDSDDSGHTSRRKSAQTDHRQNRDCRSPCVQRSNQESQPAAVTILCSRGRVEKPADDGAHSVQRGETVDDDRRPKQQNEYPHDHSHVTPARAGA